MTATSLPCVALADVACLKNRARERHYVICEADLQHALSKQQLIQSLLDALACPYAASANFDALADVMRDLSWLPPQQNVLCLLHGLPTVQQRMPLVATTLHAIMHDAMDFAHMLERRLVVASSVDSSAAEDHRHVLMPISHLIA